MKIPFKWEKLGADTLRAKVFGGWVLLNADYSSETADVCSSVIVFIPDPNHEWEI